MGKETKKYQFKLLRSKCLMTASYLLLNRT